MNIYLKKLKKPLLIYQLLFAILILIASYMLISKNTNTSTNTTNTPLGLFTFIFFSIFFISLIIERFLNIKYKFYILNKSFTLFISIYQIIFSILFELSLGSFLIQPNSVSSISQTNSPPEILYIAIIFLIMLFSLFVIIQNIYCFKNSKPKAY